MQLMCGTKNGLKTGKLIDQRWEKIQVSLENVSVTTLAVQIDRIYAGTKNGVYISKDFGITWNKINNSLSDKHLRKISFNPSNENLVLAGTEPASVFVSRDRGITWKENRDVPLMRERFHWSLPYSPETGCVRDFSFNDTSIFGAVEEGGLIHSEDNGEKWHLVEGNTGEPGPVNIPPEALHPDVHSVNVHPKKSDWIFAATGGGFYFSPNNGSSWKNLYSCYCRAFWIDRENPQHIILGPAEGVDRNGKIEETYDEGKSWKKVQIASDIPFVKTMVEDFHDTKNMIFALLSNGEILYTRKEKLEWKKLLHINNVLSINTFV